MQPVSSNIEENYPNAHSSIERMNQNGEMKNITSSSRQRDSDDSLNQDNS